MIKWTPIDIIAIIVIIGGFALLATGSNGIVAAMLMGVATYYFGKRTSTLPKQ